MYRPTVFSSTRDYIEQRIRPSLGDEADNVDLDGLAADMLSYYRHEDKDGNTLLNYSGFIETPGLDFWHQVHKHTRF